MVDAIAYAMRTKLPLTKALGEVSRAGRKHTRIDVVGLIRITQQPLLSRKSALASTFKKPLPSIMFVGHFENGAAQHFKEAVLPSKRKGF
ncbi:hypothetical protein [Variovorax paradoxus]|uniref:hypothetical protein n=1 Tax=Variovorax paradoxus TaxID=34073 RepID=UPI003ED0ABDC